MLPALMVQEKTDGRDRIVDMDKALGAVTLSAHAVSRTSNPQMA